MTIALAVLTVLTGAGKSISVCGINSALVARPSAGASRIAIAVYLIGLLLGAALLTIAIASVGRWIAEWWTISPNARRAAVGVLLLTLGALESLHGAWLLPHIGWAVPRTWVRAIRNEPFLFVFGLIRGVAIFNHSPFASMHAWLLSVFLLPEQIAPPTLAVLLALGLGTWTLAIWILGLFPTARSEPLILELTQSSLISTRSLGRLDGIALCVIGGWILL